MKKYFLVKIVVTTTNDKGKDKEHTEEYLTQSVSVTDAEISITEHFKHLSNFQYRVASVRESKIVEVISK